MKSKSLNSSLSSYTSASSSNLDTSVNSSNISTATTIPNSNLSINNTTSSGYVSTTTPSWNYTYGTAVNYNDFIDLSGVKLGRAFRLVINTSTEKQLRELADRVLEKAQDAEDKEIFITLLFKNRHLSEDFILDYINYVPENERKETVYLLHEADIVSGEYSRLALLFLVK